MLIGGVTGIGRVGFPVGLDLRVASDEAIGKAQLLQCQWFTGLCTWLHTYYDPIYIPNLMLTIHLA
jgi:hypothetical protein